MLTKLETALTVEQVVELNKLSKKLGRSRASLIRQAIHNLLNQRQLPKRAQWDAKEVVEL